VALSPSELRDATANLLWAAAAPWPDLAVVTEAFDRGFDPVALARGAHLGRVAGLVLANLDAAGRPGRGEPWAQRLVAEAGLRRSQEAVLLGRVLEAGVGPLVDAGLEPLVLKGPALLDRYPGPGLRGMDDVDVLVDAADRARAVRALRAAGWREVHHDRATGYDVPFVRDDLPGLPIELHVGLDRWWERNSAIRAPFLRASRRPFEVCGVPAFRLPPEEELVYVASHAAKPWHIFSRLIWVADLAVIARGAVDWDRIGHLADRLRCRVPVAVGLTLAARLGAPVPAGAVTLPSALVRSGALDDLLDPTWALDPDPTRRSRIASALMDRRINQLRLALGQIGIPASRGRRLSVARLTVRGAVRWTWRQRHADRAGR